MHEIQKNVVNLNEMNSNENGNDDINVHNSEVKFEPKLDDDNVYEDDEDER